MWQFAVTSYYLSMLVWARVSACCDIIYRWHCNYYTSFTAAAAATKCHCLCSDNWCYCYFTDRMSWCDENEIYNLYLNFLFLFSFTAFFKFHQLIFLLHNSHDNITLFLAFNSHIYDRTWHSQEREEIL